MTNALHNFGFSGDLETALSARQRYATDASVYEELPLAIAFPKHLADVQALVRWSQAEGISLTPRGAGTSLAGQAIGSGVLVDLTRYFRQIVAVDLAQMTVTVEAGVVLDELNAHLRPMGVWLAVDTSTANRCVLGGVVGNNSCGTYSLRYATPRDQILSVQAVLSSAETVTFADTSADTFAQLSAQNNLEGTIYRQLDNIISQDCKAILAAFPDPSLIRRNTGYALDALAQQGRWSHATNAQHYANLAPLICGSEGTLAIVTQMTFRLTPLPKARALLVAHFDDVFKALDSTPRLLDLSPVAVELIDAPTLNCTKGHAGYERLRSWVVGEPSAVQVMEFFADSAQALADTLANATDAIQKMDGVFAVVPLQGAEMSKVWEIRKAGLGLLMGKRGAKKAVAVIEDAVVPIRHLSAFMRDIRALMAELAVNCIYYGHASVGLIHLRPELDLADSEDKQKFVLIAQRVSRLVKHYRGALSGEHGDGRLRAPFLPEQFGQAVYALLVKTKQTFDPDFRLNPSKIISQTPIDHSWRVPVKEVKIATGFAWQEEDGLGSAIERCNGAGACRQSNGKMCPSFQATRDDADSTRGRANVLRFALQSPNPRLALSGEALQHALERCLGCKACHVECPACVDMAKLKSEVRYQTQHKRPLGVAWLYRHYTQLLPLLRWWYLPIQWLNKGVMVWNQHREAQGKAWLTRPFPHLASPLTSVKSWWKQQAEQASTADQIASPVLVLVDPFSQHQHPERVEAVLSVLQTFGARIQPLWMTQSPRLLISQGLLDEAKQELARLWQEIHAFLQTNPTAKIVGIEPSELLVWRDEALDLLAKDSALKQHQSAFQLFEEWLADWADTNPDYVWQKLDRPVVVHWHCHQKALSNVQKAEQVLRLIAPEVQVVSGGCCGMSGSFGYEQTELSRQIAQAHFIPSLQQAQEKSAYIITNGTSCTQQAKDLVQVDTVHIAELVRRG